MSALNPFFLYLASGESLYPGAALLLFVVTLSPYARRNWQLRLRNIAAWVGLTMLVMACPPFPWVVDVVYVAGFTFWFIVWNRRVAWPMARSASALLLAIMSIILTGFEISHRGLPRIAGPETDHVVVIGDSVSAGIDSRVPPWPLVMQQMTGARVKNLAQAGAFSVDGIEMSSRVTPEDQLVLIELGGNDLIAGVPSKQFSKSLEQVLQKLTTPGRTIVMFELPLLPQLIAYGQIQRRLAKRYDVKLIPKRYFASIIGEANATSDGLHLTRLGSQRMATFVIALLQHVLKPADVRPTT